MLVGSCDSEHDTKSSNGLLTNGTMGEVKTKCERSAPSRLGQGVARTIALTTLW